MHTHPSTHRSFSTWILAWSLSLAFGWAVEPDWLIDPAPFVAKIRPSSDGRDLELANGLVRRVIRLQPAAATIAFDNLMTSASLLRSARPEAVIELNGQTLNIGGLTGQPIHNYLSPGWLDRCAPSPSLSSLPASRLGRTEPRFAWKKHSEWLSLDRPWPPSGAAVTLTFRPPTNCPLVTVAVHYELYDGLPLLSKWLSISNGSSRPVMLNRLVVEQLAVVEPESIVDGAATNFRGTYRDMEVFSDYSFGGDMTANADAPAIHWKSDPLYSHRSITSAKPRVCLNARLLSGRPPNQARRIFRLLASLRVRSRQH